MLKKLEVELYVVNNDKSYLSASIDVAIGTVAEVLNFLLKCVVKMRAKKAANVLVFIFFTLWFCQGSAIPYKSGAYAGALVGGVNTDYSASNQGMQSASKSDSDYAWNIFAGYNFNRNFAIHFGYIQFSDVKFTGIDSISEARSKYSQKALEFSGKLIYPLSTVASAYIKGGAAFVNLDRSPNTAAAIFDIPSSDQTKIQPIYGVGIAYELYPNFSIVGEASQISGGDSIETSTIVGVGIQLAIG